MLRHAVLAIVLVVAQARAQDSSKPTAQEEKAKLARRGAGAMVGSWSLLDSPGGGVSVSDSPIGIGYFRSGLDQHLALETTVGIWKRDITAPATGGIGGSAGGKQLGRGDP